MSKTAPKPVLKARCHHCKHYTSGTARQIARHNWVLIDGEWWCPRPACIKARPLAAPQGPRDYIGHMRQVFEQHRNDFLRLFGRPLKEFWDQVYGLDVVKLDDEVIQSGERKMLYVTSTKFGTEASHLLRHLLASERQVESCAKIPYSPNK